MSNKVYYSLYDRMLHKETLLQAFKRVKTSRGTGGIDNQDIDGFESCLTEEVTLLLNELKDKSYKPLPVKRVEIPKENGKVRNLGIPSIRDRVVQQALLTILQPIYEEDFHPSSYGYRPKKSCHQAISKASLFVRKYELEYAVDMDLSKCFDTLNHDLIIKFMRKRVTDGSILKLIRLFLESGVMIGHKVKPTFEGSPQGGVISPLLANIYLNEFDQFMKSRNYRIVRYADDILILCPSLRSAEHAKEVATQYLEGTLKLKVNMDKTHIAYCSDGIKYLGVIITRRYTRIQEKKIETFKEKVKKLTRRNQCINLRMVLDRLNPVIRGFAYYFRIANCKMLFKRLMEWIRRRLRAFIFKQWKKPSKLHRRLRQLGHTQPLQKIRMNCWRNSISWYASNAIPSAWLCEQGLFQIDSVGCGIFVSC